LGIHAQRQQDLEYLNQLLEYSQGEIPELDLAKCRSRVAVRWASFKIDEGEFMDAVDCVQEILNLADQYELDDDVFDAYYLWSQILYRQGNYSAAKDKGLEGLEYAREIHDLEAESRLMNILGLIALEQKILVEAQENFKDSLTIAEDIHNLRDQAMPLNNLGNSALLESNFSLAQDYYERSLDHARTIGDRAGEGLVLGNLGYIAGIIGDYQAAKEFNDQSLQAARQTGNRVQEGYALINISTTQRILEEYSSALLHAKQSLEVSREIGDRSAEAWSLTSLGNIYFATNDFESAESAYESAVEIRRNLDQPNLASEPMAGQGRIALEMGDIKAAVGFITSIIGYLEQGGTLEGTDEPVRVYLTCFQILHKADDPRAELPLEAGHQLILTRATGIKDEVVRKNFIEKVPHNQEILSAWEAHQL
jgi:tetratricopeptide (TPR) repeat protein